MTCTSRSTHPPRGNIASSEDRSPSTVRHRVLVTLAAVLFATLAHAEGELQCPADYQPLEASELQMPEVRSTGDMHNPQEADVVVEFVVDSAGVVSAPRVIRSETWAVRKGRPSRPNYFDQVVIDQVGSRKYAPRSQKCRAEATFKFRFGE